MKKIINSKNIVTILGIVILVGILFFFYAKRVDSAINPITVPYAKKQIAAGVKITADMVDTTEVPPSMVTDDTIKNLSDVIGKYSNADTIIPEGSLFTERNAVDKEKLPANIILDYPEGYVLYNLSVNTTTTYGNSIYPGNYIDLYLKASTKSIDGMTSSNSKVVLGKLISNIQVIAVKDGDGKPVFKDLEERRAPAMIVFAVPEEYYILIKKVEYLRTYDAELITVPTNEGLKNEPGALTLSSESLKNWINEVTRWQ